MAVTEDHLRLLQGMCELLKLDENYGYVPCFDAKRPFGNSMRHVVARDAAEHLGWDDFDDDDEEQIDRAISLVVECTEALRELVHAELEVRSLARDVLNVANPNAGPWQCDAFKKLDEALRRVGS